MLSGRDSTSGRNTTTRQVNELLNVGFCNVHGTLMLRNAVKLTAKRSMPTLGASMRNSLRHGTGSAGDERIMLGGNKVKFRTRTDGNGGIVAKVSTADSPSQ